MRPVVRSSDPVVRRVDSRQTTVHRPAENYCIFLRSSVNFSVRPTAYDQRRTTVNRHLSSLSLWREYCGFKEKETCICCKHRQRWIRCWRIAVM
jgi:hypothetical protein